MKVLETQRLVLRTVESGDAPFYLNMVNDRSFVAALGDRGIRTLADARQAIAEGPVRMQATRGHSIYLVELKGSGVAIGMSGLIKRDTLDEVDLGYAFLPQYCGQGYAAEAAAAVLDYARDQLGMKRVVAIVSPRNHASNKLLTRIGMRFEKMVHLAPDDSGTRLYACDLNTHNPSRAPSPAAT